LACGAAAAAAPAAESPQRASPAASAPVARDTSPDVRFIRGMLAHHAQALEMTALVPGRTTRQDIHLLAERIDVSQRDEIALMERWLRARGEAVPAAGEHTHHGADHPQMPGMLTPEEMSRLAAASGAEFDRLFLELMIRHHEGALAMVAELFATPGGGQASDIFQIASDVDADQRAEIARMQRMLAGPLPAPGPR
ncbi:MAG TPA: DUF305 domain-containing protein, partial [Longimicrobium sp.]|nr:DUF305 domain-containing protein [Longimicrobium sp.]